MMGCGRASCSTLWRPFSSSLCFRWSRRISASRCAISCAPEGFAAPYSSLVPLRGGLDRERVWLGWLVWAIVVVFTTMRLRGIKSVAFDTRLNGYEEAEIQAVTVQIVMLCVAAKTTKYYPG